MSSLMSKVSALTADHVVQLVSSLAWPVTTLAALWTFRSELARLLERLSLLKLKGAEATFAQPLSEAESDANQVDELRSAKTVTPVVKEESERLRLLAEASPRAAVMEAWAMIETAAYEAGYAAGSTIPRVSAGTIVRLLSDRLPPTALRLLEDLRRLRNRAAHHPDVVISTEDAERYLELAARAASMIRASAKPLE